MKACKRLQKPSIVLFKCIWICKCNNYKCTVLHKHVISVEYWFFNSGQQMFIHVYLVNNWRKKNTSFMAKDSCELNCLHPSISTMSRSQLISPIHHTMLIIYIINTCINQTSWTLPTTSIKQPHNWHKDKRNVPRVCWGETEAADCWMHHCWHQVCRFWSLQCFFFFFFWSSLRPARNWTTDGETWAFFFLKLLSAVRYSS